MLLLVFALKVKLWEGVFAVSGLLFTVVLMVFFFWDLEAKLIVLGLFKSDHHRFKPSVAWRTHLHLETLEFCLVWLQQLSMSPPLWYNCSDSYENHGNMDGVQGLLWAPNVHILWVKNVMTISHMRGRSMKAKRVFSCSNLVIILCRRSCQNKTTCNKLLINPRNVITIDVVLHTSENWQNDIKRNTNSTLHLFLPVKQWDSQNMEECSFCPEWAILCHCSLPNIWSITYRSLDQTNPIKFSFVSFLCDFTHKLCKCIYFF